MKRKIVSMLLALTLVAGGLGQIPSITVSAADIEENQEQEAYKYAYAALDWDEYWKSEGVYLSGDNWTASSSEIDNKGETDKGAFDVVTRATTNHGLHRGSFQCSAVIYDTDGQSYPLSHWSSDGKTIYLTNGETVSFSKGTITKDDGTTAQLAHYEVTGIKYVPVAVKAEDYEAFCDKYTVVENGGDLTGGYAEQQLSAYSVTANVTENTNGLKEAVKNEDGTFSFEARKTGTDSGIADAELTSASEIVTTVKPGDGAYGEFLRVDLTGSGYGALGSKMQTVKWTYYGDDSTYTNPIISYGTKFASDNWMHKSNGIQLGLTESLRCQLPENTDGTGYWSITLYALGYEDYTTQFQVTGDNIVKPEEEEADITELKAAVDQAEALNKDDYCADSWASLETELEEAKEELASPHTQAITDEAKEHLLAAINALEKHSYGAEYVKKQATVTADGQTAKKCSKCNAESIAATIARVGTITLNKTSFAYNGKVQKPSVTVKDKNGNTIAGSNYTVAIPSGKAIGNYTVTVTFKNQYSGSKGVNYTITPKKTTAKLSSVKKNSMKVGWKKISGVSGYQIQYSTSSSFKNAKTVKATSKKTSAVIKKLKKNKKYYVRVRSYKKVSGGTVYSDWSSKVSKKTKK